jgi:hypothetical protein
VRLNARAIAVLPAAVALAGTAGCAGHEEVAAPGDARNAVSAVNAAPAPDVQREAPPAGPPAGDAGLPPQVPLRAAGTARVRDVRVVRGWLAAQRAGALRRAARSWRLPARYQSRSAVITVSQPEARMALVASFRCGARLAHAGAAGAFVVVQLRLVGTPAPQCSARAGNLARAAIRVGYGQISEYYRLPDDPHAVPQRQKPHPVPGWPGHRHLTA